MYSASLRMWFRFVTVTGKQDRLVKEEKGPCQNLTITGASWVDGRVSYCCGVSIKFAHYVSHLLCIVPRVTIHHLIMASVLSNHQHQPSCVVAYAWCTDRCWQPREHCISVCHTVTISELFSFFTRYQFSQLNLNNDLGSPDTFLQNRTSSLPLPHQCSIITLYSQFIHVLSTIYNNRNWKLR